MFPLGDCFLSHSVAYTDTRLIFNLPTGHEEKKKNRKQKIKTRTQKHLLLSFLRRNHDTVLTLRYLLLKTNE